MKMNSTTIIMTWKVRVEASKTLIVGELDSP